MMENNSVWVPVKSKRFGIVAYMEKFWARGQLVTIPGCSRWIDGATLDLSKAYLPE